jgi:hypothetical protein
MSLEHALQQLRNTRVEPPSFVDVVQRRAWKAERALPKRRLSVALIATVAAIVGYLILTIRPLVDFAYRNAGGLEEWWRVSVATLVPAALLVWGYRCARRDGVGPQMLSRAIWWSNLVVGMLIAGNFLARVDQLVGAGIAVACAVPLLSLGSRGLDAAPGDPFQPVRFRGHLLLALVMAFADAQTLLFSAVMQLRLGVLGWNLHGTIVYAGPTALAALVMALTVWGLYRLRTWALFLNLVANFAIAYLAIDGVLNLAPPVALALFATAACQAMLPVPILAIALGDRKAGQPWLVGISQKLLHASVIAIAGAAIVLALAVEFPDGWLTGPGRAFRRGMELGYAPREYVAQMRGLPHRRKSLRGADLSGMSGVDYFNDADLSHANLTDTRFATSQFEKANLVGADLSRGDFTRATFVRANLTDAHLVGATLAYADLRAAGLSGANLERADLRGAKIDAGLPPSIRWAGATCPDGAPADIERGCSGHEGHVSPDETASYRGKFAMERGWGEYCVEHGVRKAVVAGGYLYFANGFHLRSAQDLFASYGTTIRYERSDDQVRIVVEDDDCGRRVFLRVD